MSCCWSSRQLGVNWSALLQERCVLLTSGPSLQTRVYTCVFAGVWYVCLQACVHLYVHAGVWYMCVHVCFCRCMFICVFAGMCTRVCADRCVLTGVCTCVCVHTGVWYVCAYVCLQVCVQCVLAGVCTCVCPDRCVYMCVWWQVYVCVHVCVCICLQKPEGVLGCVSLITLSLYFLRQCLSVNLKIIDLSRVGWPLSFRDLFSLPPEPWGYRHMLVCLVFYTGCGDPNSGPLCLCDRHLWTEPDLQPRKVEFNRFGFFTLWILFY